MTTLPGVHISDGGPPPAIQGVATDVPVFIGYTETAANPADGSAAYLRAVDIRSMQDYTLAWFGGRFRRSATAPCPRRFRATTISRPWTRSRSCIPGCSHRSIRSSISGRNLR